MTLDIGFCPEDCPYLTPNEAVQDSIKSFGRKELPPHFCRKYKKVVKHRGFHPKIIKLRGCLEDSNMKISKYEFITRN